MYILKLLGLSSEKINNDFFGELTISNYKQDGIKYITMFSHTKYFRPTETEIMLTLMNRKGVPSGAQKEVYKYLENNYSNVAERINNLVSTEYIEEAKEFKINNINNEFTLMEMSIEEINNTVTTSLEYLSKGDDSIFMGVNFVKLEIDSIEIYSL